MSGAGVAFANDVRGARRIFFGGRLRDRIASWVALASVAAFALGEVLGVESLLTVVQPLFAQLPSLRPEYLLERLLRTAYTGAGFLLLLGTLTTAVSALFLSEELTLRVTLPIPHGRLVTRQTGLTIVTAAAPTLLVVLPLLVVGGRWSPAPLLFLAATLPAVLGIVVLAGSAGTALALVLVRAVPPRRARLLAAFLSAIGLAGALVGFRAVQPERLLDPVAALTLVTALGEAPPEPPGGNPFAWAARATIEGLYGHGAGPTIGLSLLAVAAVALAVVPLTLTTAHLHVWRRTREEGGEAARSSGRRRSVTGLSRTLLWAEAVSLVRDASTPAQLGSLAAVFVLDLLNVRLLPSTDPAARDLVAGLQTGLALFLVSALSLRFAYPAVSADGRAALLLRTLPLSPARHLAARYWVRALPALAASLVLVGLSDLALRPGRAAVLASLLIAVTGGLAIPALHLGLGGLFPRYGAPNAVAVALGPGGLFALTLSTGLSLASTGLVSSELRGLLGMALRTPLPQAPLVLVWVLGAATCGVLPMLLAARALERTDVG